jgi:NAD(P)-dependent dehydrogenase (short-subunit alcohol dehydrogenase family)
MDEKIALITGASKGLGKALTEILVNQGYLVYVGIRDLTKVPQGAIGLKLDLTDQDSIQNCVNKIIVDKGSIDLLVNNAAIAYWGAADSMTVEEVKALFEINLFGTFRLTQLVIPYMREKNRGRIVFVSSIRGVESCAFMGMYAATKAALEAMAFDWAVTLSRWNIDVSVVQPGPLNTGIEIMHGAYFKNRENPYLPYPEISIEYQTVSEAAQAIAKHISEPNPPFRFQTSPLAQAIIAKHLKDPSGKDWLKDQKSIIDCRSVSV